MSMIETEKQKVSLELEDFDNPLFMVEATSCERLYLWARYSYQSVTRHSAERTVIWESLQSKLYTIGHLENRPIVVSISWHRINAHVVMFYEATSKLVDWAMIESWLAKQFPHIKHKCDAQHFHHCLEYLEKLSRVQLQQILNTLKEAQQ
jgi:hypothetical protein